MEAKPRLFSPLHRCEGLFRALSRLPCCIPRKPVVPTKYVRFGCLQSKKLKSLRLFSITFDFLCGLVIQSALKLAATLYNWLAITKNHSSWSG